MVTIQHSRGLAVCSERQLQGEGGSPPGSVTMDPQSAAHFAGRQRAAVQAKAMPVGPGGEARREDASQILLGNTQAVVGDGEGDALVVPAGEAEGQQALR